jgi:hypothetical protein
VTRLEAGGATRCDVSRENKDRSDEVGLKAVSRI